MDSFPSCSLAVDDTTLVLEKDDLFDYRRLRIVEVSFDKQKSRVRRLPMGDQITIYLHRRVASIRMRNKILSTLTNFLSECIDYSAYQPSI